MKVQAASLLLLPLAATAFLPAPPAATPVKGRTVVCAAGGPMSRKDALKTAGAAMLSLGLGIPALLQGRPAFAAAANTLASGIQYDVLEKGSGASPNIGELAAIRFTGSYNGVVFDDLYKTKEPLYFRVGGGTLLPGIEEAVKAMKVGDRWKLQIPGDLAFGKKGRPASPGKPRIPPGATVEYDLTLVGLPGREVEIIDLLDFDENAPASDDSAPNKGYL